MASFYALDGAGTNVQTFSGDRSYICQATPSSGGTVTNGRGRVRITATGSTLAKMVIYSDSSGEPNTLLAVSDEVTVNWTTSTETNFPFSGANQISIVGSTPYWIGFIFDDPGTPSFEMKRNNTTGVVRYKSVTYPTAPSPFSADGSSAGPLNAVIDYTEAGTLYTKSFSDSVTLSEAIAKKTTKPRSDTISLSDSVRKAISRTRTETLTMSESFSKKPIRTFTDTFSITDSILAAIIFVKIFSDTIGLTDVIRKFTHKRYADTATLSENVSKTVRRTFSDTITTLDVIRKAVTKRFSETLSLGELFSKGLVYVRVFSDTIGLTDVFSRGMLYVRTFSDSIGLTDIISKFTHKRFSDRVTLTDTLKRYLNGLLIEWSRLVKEVGSYIRGKHDNDTYNRTAKETGTFARTPKENPSASTRTPKDTGSWDRTNNL